MASPWNWPIMSSRLPSGRFSPRLMFIVMRREAQVNIQSGMSAEGLLQQNSGMGFGKAKKNLDRKLATIQDLLRQQNQGDRQLAEERFNRRRQEQASAEEEARRQRELDEARRQSELEDARRREEEDAARRAAERDQEEARLAAEQEAARQAEMAEAEEERLAEIEAPVNKKNSSLGRRPNEPCPNSEHVLSVKEPNPRTFRFR